MLTRNSFCAAFFSVVIFWGCNNAPVENNITNTKSFINTAPVDNPVVYTITEDFETGKKANYKTDDVDLISGKWKLKDALIGEDSSDVKNGKKSVRLRSGSLIMNFDLANVKQISIKHARYGKDPESEWQLYFSVDSGGTYRPLGMPVYETDTILKTDSFALNITRSVRFKIVKKGKARVNIDDITFKGIGDAGIVVGIPEEQTPDTLITSAAVKRGVIIGPDAPPAKGDNSNMLFGNPSGAEPIHAMKDNFLMDMGYYIESYNSSKAGPNWVSWHLDAGSINSTAPRLNNFAAFDGLPDGWFAVKSSSYNYKKYGFDRGHNCPSADRTSSANANSSTFLMTNMIPQAPNNNQETWGNFEDYLRSLALQGNELYIIMGNYGTGGTGAKGYFSTISAGQNTINVPAYIWKVAVVLPVGNNDLQRVNKFTQVIAINVPNKNDVEKNWKKYQVSVRQIEAATGYNLLSNLPQQIQDILENKNAALP